VKFKRRQAAREKEIAQIFKEDPMPRRQLEEQLRDGFVLLGLDRWGCCGHVSK
jgi:hypothetical protein